MIVPVVQEAKWCSVGQRPATHVGADLSDQLQRGLRPDGMDLTQVSAGRDISWTTLKNGLLKAPMKSAVSVFSPSAFRFIHQSCFWPDAPRPSSRTPLKT
jgi:hypothetical protein